MDLAQFSTTIGLAAGLSFHSLLALLLVGVAQRLGIAGLDGPAARLGDPAILGLLAVVTAAQLVAERRPDVAQVVERVRTPLAVILGAALGGAQAGAVGIDPLLMAVVAGGAAGATRATSKLFFAPFRPFPRLARVARRVESGLASLFVLVALTAGELALPLLGMIALTAGVVIIAVLAGIALASGHAARGGTPHIAVMLQRAVDMLSGSTRAPATLLGSRTASPQRVSAEQLHWEQPSAWDREPEKHLVFDDIPGSPAPFSFWDNAVDGELDPWLAGDDPLATPLWSFEDTGSTPASEL